MNITSSKVRLSCLYNWNRIWKILTILAVCSIPSFSHAQQPTATVREVSGQVLASGAVPVKIGTVLQSGDTIQTQAGASVVLEISDGSRLEIGENTSIDLAELIQEPATGARVSRLKLYGGA